MRIRTVQSVIFIFFRVVLSSWILLFGFITFDSSVQILKWPKIVLIFDLFNLFLFVRLIVNSSKFLRIVKINEYKFCDLFYIILCNFDGIFSLNVFEIRIFFNLVIAFTQSVKIQVFKTIFIEYAFLRKIR